jgi:hypothetical protein
MLAAIRVEEKALTDPRYAILGRLMGVDKFSARGRVEMLWSHCTEIKSYFLTSSVIDTLAECEGFSELICHPEVKLGEKTDSGIRIKGTRGRIEWLAKLRKSSEKGGEKTRAKWLANRGPKDRPNEGQTLGPPTPVLTPTPVNDLKKKKVFVLPREMIEGFKTFWDAYGKKVGRAAAEKAYAARMETHSFTDIMNGLESLNRYKTASGEIRPHPATFLNNLPDYLQPDYGQETSAAEKTRQRMMSV